MAATILLASMPAIPEVFLHLPVHFFVILQSGVALGIIERDARDQLSVHVLMGTQLLLAIVAIAIAIDITVTVTVVMVTNIGILLMCTAAGLFLIIFVNILIIITIIINIHDIVVIIVAAVAVVAVSRVICHRIVLLLSLQEK